MGSACKSDLSVRYKESGIEEMRRQLGIFQQQSQNIIDSELLDETIHKKFQRQQSLTLFDWSENREDGKHTEENRVENSVFHCLAKERK